VRMPPLGHVYLSRSSQFLSFQIRVNIFLNFSSGVNSIGKFLGKEIHVGFNFAGKYLLTQIMTQIKELFDFLFQKLNEANNLNFKM